MRRISNEVKKDKNSDSKSGQFWRFEKNGSKEYEGKVGVVATSMANLGK
jgi:hypothetical protein